MKTPNHFQLLLIDAVGCIVTSACLTTAVWFGWHRTSVATQELGGWRQVVEHAKQELARERERQDHWKAVITQREQQLEIRGRLPNHFPVDEYFRTLAKVAADHKIRIVEQLPLAAMTYPGLLEQRYQFQVAAELPDLMQFLRAIEELDYWGDVGYLKVTKGTQGRQDRTATPNATLTISMFSARVETADPDVRAS